MKYGLSAKIAGKDGAAYVVCRRVIDQGLKILEALE
jgi:hypothetical protein